MVDRFQMKTEHDWICARADEKGDWVRHSDYAALQAELETVKGERDEAERLKCAWFETHIAHQDANQALGRANTKLFKRAADAERRAEAAEAKLAGGEAVKVKALQDHVEQLAAFLCSEFDFDLNPCVGYSWPEHENDDGYRDGGYVKLQPSDVQAHARNNAKRILSFISALTHPAPTHEDGSGEKIDLSALDAWFPNGVPMVAVKIMFPEKSEPLSTEEVRHVLAALALSHTSGEVTEAWPDKAKFQWGDRVTKTKGSSWTGRVCGIYSTALTPIGYAVESENEPGSVQIYPEAALRSIASGGKQ